MRLANAPLHNLKCRSTAAASSNALNRVHRRVDNVLARATATKSTDVYVAGLEQAEGSGDWLRAFELLTEANALQVALPGAALERGIRTLARGGQAHRAKELLSHVESPSEGTLVAVFSALAGARQLELAEQLLQDLHQQGASQQALNTAHNMYIKALARGGHAVRAYEVVESLLGSKGSAVVQLDTYSCLCAELMKVGEVEKAEEVLEWREFLHVDE